MILRNKLLFNLHRLEREFFFLTKHIKIIKDSIYKVLSAETKINHYFLLLSFLEQKLKVNIFSLKKTLTSLF